VYSPITPSAQVYGPLDEAFNHFSRELFGDALPYCLVTVWAKGPTCGFHHAKRFAKVEGNATTDEIAMNPRFFRTEPLREVASTFAHEMVHHWQEHFGTPPRNGYHDREWAAKMISIGLMPSSTGKPGGKQTGYHVSDYVIEGGPFALSFARLEATGWRIGWGDADASKSVGEGGGGGEGALEGSKPTRTKFICSGGCGLKMYGPSWAKEDLLHKPCGRPLVAA
jgi:SprT-like family